jgi:hypothetical protein
MLKFYDGIRNRFLKCARRLGARHPARHRAPYRQGGLASG